jgi:hypothetical protein
MNNHRGDFVRRRLISLRAVIMLTMLFVVSQAVTGVFAQTNPVNSLTIREKAGITTNNYPIQIARPFVQGEIRNYPQAVISGKKLTTQADVKSRWPDGSVRHAVLSFYIPTLAAGSSVTVTFANQTSGNNTGFLTKAGMLSKTWNFEAMMELTNVSTVTASARAILNAGSFQYWNKGSVMTSIILADHSLNRAYDIGFDSRKSFRPIFLATFWPTINKVWVRFIGEIANTEALQDQKYSLTLKLGDRKPQKVYSKGQMTHIAASRWTKEFWLGGAPPAIEINHNLAYLRQTRALPNYDTTKSISEAVIASAYSDPVTGWTVAPKDLFDTGNLTKYMPTTGGRDEIGPYPTWTVRWLYTGDWRMRELTFGNADLAAAFPVHFREGSGTKQFDRNGTPAIGKVLSIVARPTVLLHAGNYYINYQYTSPADKITPVGAMTDGGWVPDAAHQPDFYSPLYTLTGDFFYLEEMYFQAAWGAANSNPGSENWYGRGPTGDTGGIFDEVRGEAWLFRNRAQTAYLAPDGTPEKNYFTTLTTDAIAIWEGTRNLTGTSFQNGANWQWGNTVAAKRYDPLNLPRLPRVPQLCFWEEGELTPSWSDQVDPATAKSQTSPWQHYFMIYALGRAKELGFPTNALLGWAGDMVIGTLTSPGYSPYLSAAYRMPTVKTDENWFSQWTEEKSGFLDGYDAQADFNYYLTDPNHGYSIVQIPAAAMIKDEPGGSAAWAFIEQQALPATSLHNNPKWAIVPRQ